jgi:hypothetical protein
MSPRKRNATPHRSDLLNTKTVQQGDAAPTASSVAPAEILAASETNPNLNAYLEERRRNLRSRFQVQPISQERREILQDILWAQQDPAVRALYEGEFVVPWKGKIIAHGDNAQAVLQEAAQITGRRVEDLPLVGVLDTLTDISG